MNILVPTDFSPLSVIAVDYAVELAKKAKADVILLHHVYLDVHGHSMVAFKAERILEVMMENAADDMQKLLSGLSERHSSLPKIVQHIIKGENLEVAVTGFATAHNADLIILGTMGASGAKKVLMGSNAASIIRRSAIPVISVPEHARFREISRIVYSSDLLDVHRELGVLSRFAGIFNAMIHIVHVDHEGKMDGHSVQRLESGIRESGIYPSVKVNVFRDMEISDALERYIDDINADMLAMFTHKTTFFENLFGRSITREMAFQSHIPLLAIKK